MEESPKLAMAARSLIEDRGDRVFVSAASVWEIAIKTAKGKLKLNGLSSQSLALEGFDPLPVTVAHAEAVMRLDLPHADPFDRLIVAQAHVEQLLLVHGDETLRRVANVPQVWAR